MDESNVDLTARAQSQTRDDVTVTVAVPTKEETRLLFGTSLYAEGIQPVWVSVDNHSAQTYVMLKAGIDDQYYSPLETAYQRRSEIEGEAGGDGPLLPRHGLPQPCRRRESHQRVRLHPGRPRGEGGQHRSGRQRPRC